MKDHEAIARRLQRMADAAGMLADQSEDSTQRQEADDLGFAAESVRVLGAIRGIMRAGAYGR